MTDKLPSPPTAAPAADTSKYAAPEASAAASASAAPASSQASDRATSFQSVEGGKEQRSGSVLLVEAYALVWFFLLAWVALLWARQRKLDARIEGLEAAIDRAVAKRAKG